VKIAQTFTSATWDGPTSLVVESTYTGGDADSMRADLASTSIADLAKDRINRLAGDLPKIKSDSPPSISDDRARNVIVLTEHYTIRDLWKDRTWTYFPRAIERHMDRPTTSIRSMPLTFDYPLNVTQVTTFRLPSSIEIGASESTIDDAAFHYESHVSHDGKTI